MTCYPHIRSICFAHIILSEDRAWAASIFEYPGNDVGSVITSGTPIVLLHTDHHQHEKYFDIDASCASYHLSTRLGVRFHNFIVACVHIATRLRFRFLTHSYERVQTEEVVLGY